MLISISLIDEIITELSLKSQDNSLSLLLLLIPFDVNFDKAFVKKEENTSTQ